MDYSIRKNCTLCKSKKLDLVLNFKKTPLANSYEKIELKKTKLFPLNVLICNACGHLQLRELVKPHIMFNNYLYVSGTSKVLVKHFQQYAEKIIKKFDIKKNQNILDIACNDGTFLENFTKKNFKNVVGVEPAKNLKQVNIKKKIKIHNFFFNQKNSNILKNQYNSFKIITANNVCAHVPDLKNFFLGIKNILAKDGCMIFEVSYLGDVIRKLTFDTIYHEHMSYHSLKPLINFFKGLDLEIFDFDRVKAQGGSIRIYISHKGKFKKNYSKINRLMQLEDNMRIFNKTLYKNYLKRIDKVKMKLKKIFQNNKKNKIKTIGYGAPAKLTTFSYVLGLKKDYFQAIVDDSSYKQKLLTPGRKIKIISFNDLSKFKFDMILIFALNFSDPIVLKLKKFFKNKKIIIPFPTVRILKI